MAKRVGVDKLLFCVTLILVVIGLAMVFSASAVMAKERFGSPYSFVIRQALYAAIGLAVMTLLMQVDYRKYNRPNVVFPAVAITVICLLAAFLMHDSHNTHRWIRFGNSCHLSAVGAGQTRARTFSRMVPPEPDADH